MNVKVNDVVKLKTKPQLGSSEGVIKAIKGDKAVYGFGVINDGVFMPRKYVDKAHDRVLVGEINIKLSDISDVVIKGDTRMASKKDQVQPLLKPSQKKASKKSGSTKLAQEVDADLATLEANAAKAAADARKAKADADKAKKKADLDAKKKKEKDDREAKKLKEKRKGVADELKKLAKEAGLKEIEAVKLFTTEVEGKSAFLQMENLLDKYKDIKADLKKKIKENAKNTSLSTRTALNDEEAAERKKLEATVKTNLGSFQKAAFEIGAALTLINEHRLYRSTHKSFKNYVVEVFDLSEPQAYSVMTAAQTFRALAGDTKFKVTDMPSIRAAEAIARGANRLIADTGLKADPEVQNLTGQVSRNIFQLAVDTAPKDKNDKPILSPAHLTSVMNVVNDIAKTGSVEVDGKAVPLSLAKASIGETIAQQSAERQKRLNQYLAERVENAKKVFEGQPQDQATINRLNSAINASPVADAEIMIPEGVTPRITLSCSIHGRRGVADMTEQYLELECGCHFTSTAEGLEFSGNKKAEKTAKEKSKAEKESKAKDAQAQAKLPVEESPLPVQA